ncbi:Tesmin/TSO1-like CXC domain containing protein [Aphelenchoides avenae]|nr:Tesmin/TSO1-like CXC domain containing protein [Aphelenchus avenae]
MHRRRLEAATEANHMGSSFARPSAATFQAPVAHIAVNSQSETRLREVNYREQQKPIIRAGVVQNATSLTPTPRKHDRREVLSGSALQGSPLTTYLNFARMTKPRKASKKRPCNCTKSMCLKLYCECFANGEFCLDCNCKDCHNNLENEAERSRAIKASLQRNPNAFKPKIGVATKGADKKDLERLHQKGCHCKKSNCLKNYCECYEAKVPCTDRCKCTSCRNTEADRSQKFKDKFSTTGLAQLAAAAAADARAASPFSDEDEDPFASEAIDPKTLPWNYPDVIEATTFCLVAQAHELETKVSEEDLERSILQEFGRCMEKMLDIATNAASNNALVASGLPPYA